MKNKLSFSEYRNKVLGGWVGKCAGGILGAPIEGYKRFNTIPFTEDLFATNFANDDLDLQVLWLDMILKKGALVREEDFHYHWSTHVEFPWCEYGIAIRNMKMGLDNPTTGTHNNWYWKNGMGSPIRSEIWGMVNPGLPEKAVFYAGIDSRLDHHGFSVTAEQYLSACASLAFFENNIKEILIKGLQYISSDSDCAKLVYKIIAWDKEFAFDIVAGKIKSYYGDADFTSAPMNIGFIILALLHTEQSFDFLIDALHLGHDSDCVVATAGALLGIVIGYDAIPEIWKKRVGNELLVSPEIANIYCPKTLTELAELTCKASTHFTNTNENVTVEGYPSGYALSFTDKSYSIYCETLKIPNPITQEPGKIILHYENHTNTPQQIEVRLIGDFFKYFVTAIQVSAKSNHQETIDIELVHLDKFNFDAVKIPYQLEITLDNKTKIHKKGFPFYGSWLLLGPFMNDDPNLVVSESKYPDHGLASLPSVKYMNHDAKKPSTVFLTTAFIQEHLNRGTLFTHPFHVQMISPKEMRMSLNDYFCGIGERSIFLYTEINSVNELTKWLALGSSSYITIWHNSVEIYKNIELIRSYPIAHTVALDLVKGKNTLLIKINSFLDNFNLEIGLKEHDGKHPHQCQWDTDLQFNAASLIESTKN